ncbi:MAG: hypothetical protein KZQ65_12435, partial [Candidatus Thiodiazotropha sp. (ex Gloverina cf. vestifex)]|nr:hypothetical protein [Candidatus Thiodiazotropha sp. (ex Gloverina cf. vestifex)]
VTITAIQPRLRLSGTNRLGFQPSMAISEGDAVLPERFVDHRLYRVQCFFLLLFLFLLQLQTCYFCP